MMNIDEMPPGREMDALIAQKIFCLNVLGWGPARCFDWWQVPFDGLGEEHPIYLRDCMCDLKEDEDVEILGHYWACLEVVPFYSTDLVMAWEVVRKMIGIPYSYEFYLCHQTDGWDVSFQHPGNKGGQAHGATAPLAICRAALKAIGDK